MRVLSLSLLGASFVIKHFSVIPTMSTRKIHEYYGVPTNETLTTLDC